MSARLFDLNGKSALITGTSRGIGEALAKGFAQAGASVAGCARSADGARRTAEAIRAAGGVAMGCSGDVTTARDADRIVSETVRTFGRLDICVANAGMDITKPALEFSADEFEQVMRGNLASAFFTAQAAARQFMAQGSGGAIVMTSSNASLVGFEQLVPYCASKGGIDALVRGLAAEWGRHGIRVNAINPGYTTHQMNPASDDIMASGRDTIIAKTPLRRIADVGEMVGPAIFLASDAAAYVTGICLPVDGGWCAV